MHFNDRNDIMELTPLWKGERFEDGRPKVPDKYLDALQGMTLEEVWKPIFVLGYENQFVGGGLAPLHTLHNDGRKLVGRAVTASYCPFRPDLDGRKNLTVSPAKTANGVIPDTVIPHPLILYPLFFL